MRTVPVPLWVKTSIDSWISAAGLGEGRLFRAIRKNGVLWGRGVTQNVANLPEEHAGRWGTGLTAAKMAECRWLKPSLVGQFEFVEWTPDKHLRHARFIGLREDKNPKDVAREIINCSK